MSCPRRDEASPEELRWGLLPSLGAALLPLPPRAALEGSADTEGTLQKPGVHADVQTPHACADDKCVCKPGVHRHVQTPGTLQTSTCAG